MQYVYGKNLLQITHIHHDKKLANGHTTYIRTYLMYG